MTERPRARRPSAALVVWGSLALFAVLFAVLTYRLSAAQAPAAPRQKVLVRRVIKRRVVTTVVPTPGASSVSSGPVTTTSTPAVSSGAAPVVTSSS
jgi:hypothetical protein